MNSFALMGYVLIAVELALFSKFFKKVNWPTRFKGLLVGFCILLTFVVLIFLNPNTTEMGPGSGIVLLFPIVGAIIGYFIGLVIDLTRKNK